MASIIFSAFLALVILSYIILWCYVRSVEDDFFAAQQKQHEAFDKLCETVLVLTATVKQAASDAAEITNKSDNDDSTSNEDSE